MLVLMRLLMSSGVSSEYSPKLETPALLISRIYAAQQFPGALCQPCKISGNAEVVCDGHCRPARTVDFIGNRGKISAVASDQYQTRTVCAQILSQAAAYATARAGQEGTAALQFHAHFLAGCAFWLRRISSPRNTFPYS